MTDHTAAAVLRLKIAHNKGNDHPDHSQVALANALTGIGHALLAIREELADIRSILERK